MQVETDADGTMILSKILTKLGNPQLDVKVRVLEDDDGHRFTHSRSLTCDFEWNACRHTQYLYVKIPLRHQEKIGKLEQMVR